MAITYIKAPDGNDTVIRYVSNILPDGRINRTSQILTRDQINKSIADAQAALEVLGPE